MEPTPAKSLKTAPEVAEELPPLPITPIHVGIVMDGNGRWAAQRGLPRLEGHRAGARCVREVAEAAVEFDVKVLTLYAFSTENWARPEAEVSGLMTLLEESIEREQGAIMENEIQVRSIGRRDAVPSTLQIAIDQLEEATRGNDRLTINFAFNYGGRSEIVDAVREIVAEGVPASHISEATITRHLYTRDLPDPDLVIRTAGEMRLSNFLLWQAAYAEYYAAQVYWPDFGREEFYAALANYSRRERKFGGLAGGDDYARSDDCAGGDGPAASDDCAASDGLVSSRNGKAKQ